jgi:hypothetical protein
MRRFVPRFRVGYLLLAIAIATPLSAAVAGYTTGWRCPLCLSGRVLPISREISCGAVERAERGEVHLDFSPASAAKHWFCRSCELKW